MFSGRRIHLYNGVFFLCRRLPPTWLLMSLNTLIFIYAFFSKFRNFVIKKRSLVIGNLTGAVMLSKQNPFSKLHWHCEIMNMPQFSLDAAHNFHSGFSLQISKPAKCSLHLCFTTFELDRTSINEDKKIK